MFDQIKIYLTIAGAAFVALFIAIFKYRGMRIDTLEKEVKDAEAKDKAQDFEAQNREAAARAEVEDAKRITTNNTFTI